MTKILLIASTAKLFGMEPYYHQFRLTLFDRTKTSIVNFSSNYCVFIRRLFTVYFRKFLPNRNGIRL